MKQQLIVSQNTTITAIMAIVPRMILIVMIKGDHVKDAKAKDSQSNERPSWLHLASKNFRLSEDHELREYVVDKERKKLRDKKTAFGGNIVTAKKLFLFFSLSCLCR